MLLSHLCLRGCRPSHSKLGRNVLNFEFLIWRLLLGYDPRTFRRFKTLLFLHRLLNLLPVLLPFKSQLLEHNLFLILLPMIHQTLLLINFLGSTPVDLIQSFLHTLLDPVSDHGDLSLAVQPLSDDLIDMDEFFKLLRQLIVLIIQICHMGI